MDSMESSALPDLRVLYGEEAWQEWRTFVEHFELARGFALLVLLLPGAGSSVCQRALEGELRSRGLRLIAFRPENTAELRSLPGRVMAVRVDEKRTEGGLWIDLTPTSYDVEAAWRAECQDLLGRLNQHRNDLARNWPLPLVLVGGEWLKSDLREAAPDLWSIRSTVATLVARGGGGVEMRESLSWALDAWESDEAADPDFAMAQARELRGGKADPRNLIELLLRASGGYRRQGRWALAEATAHEARALVEGTPGPDHRWGTSYARALAAHSAGLWGLNRFHEALQPACEAVAVFQDLAQRWPRKHKPAFAQSLAWLGYCLNRSGQEEEALEVTQRAVDLARELVGQDREKHISLLAAFLNDLAGRMGELGRSAEALAALREAVAVCRELVSLNPNNRHALAMFLRHMGQRLVQAGRFAEALQALDECVDLLRRIAADVGDPASPELAESMLGRARIFELLGDPTKALESNEEALRFLLPAMKHLSPDAAAIPIGGITDYLRLCTKLGRLPDESLWAAYRGYEALYHRYLRGETEALSP
jgi:tetratricopeptide (TPR) repeat protein